MNPRLLIAYASASLLIVAAALPAYSVGVTLNDSCGTSLAGSTNATVNVAPSGDLTISPYLSSGVSAGFGLCETLAAGQLPRCALFASASAVEPNASVTLVAACATPPGGTTYTWTGPAGLTPLSSARTQSVLFPNPGSYTYTVSAGLGLPSNPVTILVGNSADSAAPPNCSVTMSPTSIETNQKSRAFVKCQPTANSFTWTVASEAGSGVAPTMPPNATTGEVTFANPGTFTLKVVPKSAANAAGPMASATVTVKQAPGSLQCTDLAVVTYAAPPNHDDYGPNVYPAINQVIANSFQVASATFSEIFTTAAPAGGLLRPMSLTYSVSRCKGDFTSPEVKCAGFRSAGSNFGMDQMNCPISPNTTYYLNIKMTACYPDPNYACGWQLYRY